MALADTDQAPIHRVGGHVALDFANTVSWRGTARERDHIASAPALLRWARDAGLIDDDGAAFDGDSDRLVAAAHRLRAAIRDTFEEGAAGNGGAARAELLAIARDSLGSARLAGEPAKLSFDTVADAILGGIAWAAIDLLGSDRLGRVKTCAPDDCRWLFLDTSKNGSRRWCDMQACGNRAKVAHHRRQRRGG